MKILLINDVLIDKNKKVKKNSITKNNEFEQIDNETILKHIKIFFFNSVNNNTNKKFFLRICRIVNFVDYQI